MSWQRLDTKLYRGPLVLTRLFNPDPTSYLRGAPPFIECWALLDTGATDSIVDSEQIARRLMLETYDTRRLAVAGRVRAEAPVHEVGIRLPEHPFPEKRIRVAGMKLPGPFWMLIGMDLIEGTRLSLECGPEGRWLRWEPL
jgi:predicted aspartyl protease